MKPKYKKARVIHDAVDDRYVVETKEGLFDKWEYHTRFRYFVEGRDYLHEALTPKLTESQAREQAIEYAQALISRVIIWES